MLADMLSIGKPMPVYSQPAYHAQPSVFCTKRSLSVPCNGQIYHVNSAEKVEAARNKSLQNRVVVFSSTRSWQRTRWRCSCLAYFWPLANFSAEPNVKIRPQNPGYIVREMRVVFMTGSRIDVTAFAGHWIWPLGYTIPSFVAHQLQILFVQYPDTPTASKLIVFIASLAAIRMQWAIAISNYQ